MTGARTRPGAPCEAQKRSRQDSNLRTRLRRPALYPLSYGSSGVDPTDVNLLASPS
jgi:hypothetical protein